MIYYNDKIVTIDFKVHDSKSYKFFIDEELCEIRVIKQRNGKYSYDFRFDRKTDTAGNRFRKANERKWSRQSVFAIFSFLVGIVIFVAIFWQLRAQFLERQLERYGVAGIAEVRVYQWGKTDKYQTSYFFNYQDGYYKSKPILHTSPPNTDEGFPLKNGDKFHIVFASNNLMNNRIDYTQPDTTTALKMIKRTAERHIQFNQGRMTSELVCETQAAFKLQGLSGLADIYYQSKSAKENHTHNTDSYLRLIRDEQFKKETSDCWMNQ
jgi:hypothetical protein